jgi:hypothetical protein
MNKFLKTILVIGALVFLYFLQMEIVDFGEIPLLETNLYPVYTICLLPILGNYLFDYSEYRKTGIIIVILSALPVLFFFLFVIMNVLSFIFGSPEPYVI